MQSERQGGTKANDLHALNQFPLPTVWTGSHEAKRDLFDPAARPIDLDRPFNRLEHAKTTPKVAKTQVFAGSGFVAGAWSTLRRVVLTLVFREV